MNPVPTELEAAVTAAQLVETTRLARRRLEREFGERSGYGSTDVINWDAPPRELAGWFRAAQETLPAAGDAALLFARAVLSIIDSHEKLSDEQQALVMELSTTIRETRPLPTLLWADFVIKHLQNPALVSRVLACCVTNTSRLEKDLQTVMRRHYNRLGLDRKQPLMVFGYSRTNVAALVGLPTEVAGKLSILTPDLALPNRRSPDGQLLRAALKDKFAVDVVSKAEALERLHRREPSVLLMGCKVIGLRHDETLEVVNSRGAREYAETAKAAQVPVMIVTGAYKLWPTATYEAFRDVLGADAGNSIVTEDSVSWLLTEDSLFRRDVFAREYRTYFTVDEIPVASVREALRRTKRVKKLCDLERQVQEVETATKVLPALFDHPSEAPLTLESLAETVGARVTSVAHVLDKELSRHLDAAYGELASLVESRTVDQVDAGLEAKIGECLARMAPLQELEGELFRYKVRWLKPLERGLEIMQFVDRLRRDDRAPADPHRAAQDSDSATS